MVRAMSAVALAFVLIEDTEYPDPERLVAAAAELGEKLEVSAESEDGVRVYAFEGGRLMIMKIDAPHPDASKMPPGIASPDAADLQKMQAHLIVTALGLPEDRRINDARLAVFTAAVVRSSASIAAMLGDGVTFHKAKFFTDVVAAAEGSLPMMVCVDVTIAPEPNERMSFLTHGLKKYGREEFYVTASQRGSGALDYLLSLAQWMLADPDKHLPTGDTVGRTAEEKITIQRVPSPTGDGSEVIRLDLDD